MLQEYLWDLGFVPSLAEPSIYMRKCPTTDHYEYIVTYIDNLAMIVIKDPKAFVDQLESVPCNFKLKGSGPLNFRLGCGFKRKTALALYV